MKKFDVICGLCVLESEELALSVATELKEKLSDYSNEINFYFKGSFDSYLKSVKNKNLSPRLKKIKKVLLAKSA